MGISAKVSTAYRNPIQTKDYGNNHVICVYIYNWKSELELFRVRNKLKELGFTEPLCFKTDNSTLSNQYGHQSHLFCRK